MSYRLHSPYLKFFFFFFFNKRTKKETTKARKQTKLETKPKNHPVPSRGRKIMSRRNKLTRHFTNGDPCQRME